MSNQLIKKNPADGYQNVFPKTFIDAIKDRESGVSLPEILQGFNMYFLSYNGSKALTRCKIPTILRKEGLWITYVLYDHTVVTEWYNSDQIDNNSWGADDNWRIASNALVGDISISADGYWVINGEKTEAKAQGEQGVTPLLRIGGNNKLQVSYNAGKAWRDISDYIVPRFRWNQGTGTTAGVIQISMDLGSTWRDLSNPITNNLRISRYIGINDTLPTSGIAEGTVYMKGPYYDEDDTSNANPIYRMWVYAWKDNTLAWQDNGEFASISAGIVQEKGNSVTEVMSQDAVTRELTELEQKVDTIPHAIYAEGCPYIVELYVNELGREAGLAKLNNVYARESQYQLYFALADGSAFAGRTILQTELPQGIVTITSTGEVDSPVYGYVLVDWANIGSEHISPQAMLTDNIYKLDMSPSIKAMLMSNKIADNTSNINIISNNLFIGEEKPLELCISQANNTEHIWFQYPISNVNHYDTLRFKAKEGVINFYKVTYIPQSNYIAQELVTSVTNSAEENGTIKTINVDIDLEENQYIGVNGAFYFKTDLLDIPLYAQNYNISSLIISEYTHQILGFEALNTSNLTSRMYKVEESNSRIDAELYDIESYILTPKKKAVLLKDTLTAEKEYITEAQTFGAFGLLVDASHAYTINKYYSLSQREMRLLCKFGDNSIARIGTVTSDDNYNTRFDIDVASQRVRCNSLDYKPCEILIPNHLITITISKNYNIQSCEICNITLGKRKLLQWVFNGQGGVGTGAIGTKVNTGMQYDYYKLSLLSGSGYEVNKIVISGAKCDMVIYGDSITEGEAYYPANMLHTHWVQQLRKLMKGDVVASGRSGTALSAIMTRIVNEIPFIKPKYVMVTIGTNGGVTASGLSELVEYIESQGAICILNHIPANINSGGVSNNIAVNTVIDEVRATYNLIGADFDIATSVNNNPTDGVNIEMMWKEDYGGSTGTVYHHPNELGSTAMVTQMMLDIPEIFE